MSDPRIIHGNHSFLMRLDPDAPSPSALAAWAGVGRKQVERADAEIARTATGYAIGGVAPFGYPQPLPVLCDEDLFQHEVIWAAAGTPNAVFETTPQALAAATGAVVASLALQQERV